MLLRWWWFIWWHYKQLYRTAIITLALVYLLLRRCDFTSPPLSFVFSDNCSSLESSMLTDSAWVWSQLPTYGCQLNCLTTDVTSREVSSSRTDLKTRSRIVRCHETTYLLCRKPSGTSTAWMCCVVCGKILLRPWNRNWLACHDSPV
jgi:hypothetical protein